MWTCDNDHLNHTLHSTIESTRPTCNSTRQRWHIYNTSIAWCFQKWVSKLACVKCGLEIGWHSCLNFFFGVLEHGLEHIVTHCAIDLHQQKNLHQKLEFNRSCCRNHDVWAQCWDCIWAWILHMLCWFKCLGICDFTSRLHSRLHTTNLRISKLGV